jgi:hypothetical protein
MKKPMMETPLRKRGARSVAYQCRLWEDQAEALQMLAEKSDIPQSTLIRHAVQRFLADHPESGFGG